MNDAEQISVRLHRDRLWCWSDNNCRFQLVSVQDCVVESDQTSSSSTSSQSVIPNWSLATGLDLLLIRPQVVYLQATSRPQLVSLQVPTPALLIRPVLGLQATSRPNWSGFCRRRRRRARFLTSYLRSLRRLLPAAAAARISRLPQWIWSSQTIHARKLQTQEQLLLLLLLLRLHPQDLSAPQCLQTDHLLHSAHGTHGADLVHISPLPLHQNRIRI